MRAGLNVIAIAVAALVGWVLLNTADIMQWAVAQQRVFQNTIADGVFALKSGKPGAWTALLGAAAAYGFVHAVGPGHGKYLIGGIGLGSSVSSARLLSLAATSSLAQSPWAILLVYGGFFLFEVSASRLTGLAENYLAPASYIAIAAIGAYLALRGIRRLIARNTHKHDHACGCHSHGPSIEEARGVQSLRDALALVGSIAIRPCTGAIFLLVIAWQMDIVWAGALAVITMGLGTAALTSIVALSSVAARQITILTARHATGAAIALPALQILAGASIMWASLLLLNQTI